jgi:hypothetical protein
MTPLASFPLLQLWSDKSLLQRLALYLYPYQPPLQSLRVWSLPNFYEVGAIGGPDKNAEFFRQQIWTVLD